MNKKSALIATVIATALGLTLVSCGGGSGSTGGSNSGSGTQVPLLNSGSNTATSSATVSSGAITAFGSVFVNGHEFDTKSARVIDDDTGLASAGTNSLDVGMVVSVSPAEKSTTTAPVAADIHLSPLARGFVDASDSVAGTITVLGQKVQLPANTSFVDHRACVSAASSPCTRISGQAGFAVTAGATAGTYVVVHGYLFSTGTAAQIIASYIGVYDYVAGSSPFKLEGQVTAKNGSTLTIGAESLDLSKASCAAKGALVACDTLAAVGDIVAARGLVAPVAAIFTANTARVSRLVPQTAGAIVEVEGRVSSVTGTNFVVRGITVDGSALATALIPAVGDKVELLATVGADGNTVKATSIKRDSPWPLPRFVMAGPVSAVTAGTVANTFNVSVLGQSVVVSAKTHISDRTLSPRPTFNIINFQTYLQSKTAYVMITAQADAGGALQAANFEIVTALSNGLVAIGGPADAAPTVGSANTVPVHGLVLSYKTLKPANATISKGNNLLAVGTLSAGVLDTSVSGGSLFVRSKNGDDDDDRGFRGF